MLWSAQVQVAHTAAAHEDIKHSGVESAHTPR
jgi:hypothetical protein